MTISVFTYLFSFQFTAKQDVCRGHLARLVSSELHAATVARIIGVMVRTHTGLDDSTTLRNMNATGTSLWEKEKVCTTVGPDTALQQPLSKFQSSKLSTT